MRVATRVLSGSVETKVQEVRVWYTESSQAL